MTYSMIKFGASSVAGAVGGNRTHRYITDGTQNITRINRNDMIATTIGTATPLLAIKAFPENRMISSIISFVATAFSVAYALTEASNNHDNNTVNSSLTNKKNDITSAKETVKNIFHETIEKSIFTDQERKQYGYRIHINDILTGNEFHEGTNFRNTDFRTNLTRDKETFDILIEKKLYPFLGTSAEDIKQSEKIAKTQKDNLEMIYTCKDKAGELRLRGRWSPKTSGFLGIEKEKELYSEKSKELSDIINDLNKIITAKNDSQSPLQEPTKTLASVIKKHIETDVKKSVEYLYQSRLTEEIERGIKNCSGDKFHEKSFITSKSSIPFEKTKEEVKTLNFSQLNEFISFIHTQEEWQKDNIVNIYEKRDASAHKDRFYVRTQDGAEKEIKESRYNVINLDNKNIIREKFGAEPMPYNQLYSERNVLTKLKNIFNQALREKYIPYESAFELDYNRYTHAQNAYKELDEAIEAQDKKPSWLEKMQKQFNTRYDTYFTSSEQSINEEHKPSPSQILTVTDTEVKAFGSKDKALEVRNQLMELKTGDTQEVFDKRKNKTFKKLSLQYHSDRPNGSDNAQAFINKINKYVDFDLAQKFWALPDDKRGH